MFFYYKEKDGQSLQNIEHRFIENMAAKQLYKEETTTIKHGLTISNRVSNFQSNDDI